MKKLCCVLVLGCLLAGTAAAGTTAISGPAPGEVSILQIIQNTYGYDGTWSPSGLNYTSTGGMSAIRIADTGGSITSTDVQGGEYISSIMDEVWHDGTVTFTVSAKYAGHKQQMGFRPGASGGTAANNVALLNTTASGYNPATSYLIGQTIDMSTQLVTLGYAAGSDWRWTRTGDGSDFNAAPHLISLASENPGGVDHMVTYRITGTGFTTWLLCWEDLTDRDFNDLVVEVRALSSETPGDLVPEPLTMASAFFAIGGLGAYIRRRTGRAAA